MKQNSSLHTNEMLTFLAPTVCMYIAVARRAHTERRSTDVGGERAALFPWLMYAIQKAEADNVQMVS